ncbi:DUF6264 family protein [Microbacterium sp. P01]|uniref:DUF6264 family protein n=1 Tax=unclassified Microbacterium TaxID=2609290 RepID=UPI0036728A50
MSASSTEPESRPRPEYGEYATIEEQRARIAQPDVTAALDAGEAVRADPVSAPVAPAGSPVAEPAPGRPVGPAGKSARAGARPGAANRIATLGLLAYGLVSVVSTVISLGDFGTYSSTMLSLMGIDATLADPDAAKGWVFAGMLVLGIGWLLTAVVSWRVMRRGRLSWWIPLVGALVFSMASGALIAVPLTTDPGIMNALSNLAG